MPRNLNLEGREVREALGVFAAYGFDHPAFVAEAAAITLDEIAARAAAFDPLTQAVDADVRAISGNAWESLGRHGLALHFEAAPGRLCEALVLCRGARGRRWEVSLDGRVMERFSAAEEAVQAVDYEVARRGRAVSASARASAGWRAVGADAARAAAVAGVRPGGRTPRTVGDVVALETWVRVWGAAPRR
jgi:ATP-dependent helicase IRC3